MKRLVSTAAMVVSILVLVPVLASANGNSWGRLHRERMEIGRALIEVQSPDWQSVLPYYTEDIEYHDPIVDIYGIDTMSQFLGQLFGSTPDLVTTVENETLVDGVYTAAWTMAGQFTGVPYVAKGISIIKFRGSSKQVYYQRDYYTEGDIMINILGLDEAATGFRTFYRCAVDPTFDCPIEPPATDAPVIPTPIKESLNPETVNRGRGSGGIHAKRMDIGRALVDVRAESWQSVLPYFDEDFEYHDPIIDIYGAETMAQFLGRFFGSNPNLVTTIEDETLDKDVYAATWTMDGQFNGVPYSAKGMSIVKFRAGTRVIYQRDYYTEGDIMLSIPGLDEAASGFRNYYRCAVDPTFDCPIEPATVLTGPETVETGGYKSKSVAMFTLQQNVPNPFNPVTKISFGVPNGGAKVSLRIYDVSGRFIRTLVDGYESSGTKTVSWDGKNSQGQPVASGTYFYQLTASSFSETKKMVLLK